MVYVDLNLSITVTESNFLQPVNATILIGLEHLLLKCSSFS